MLFQQAVASSMTAAEGVFTGETDASRAAFTTSYNKEAQRLAALRGGQQALSNLAAIKQDRILTNTQINMAQQQAEAEAVISAAVAGVEGQSVLDIIDQTQKSEVYQKHAAAARAEQESEQQLAAIGNQRASLLSIRDDKISMFGQQLQAFSSLDRQDVKNFEAFFAGDK